ncbi:hypothetical protein [Acinetobacter sp. BSP-53]|uniref:hypothetical protein n=1 Tax=Acinetobacter sp. BSP-53 TaxID=3344662 RepID=UPI00377052DB
MNNTRTNTLLLKIITNESNLPFSDRCKITVLINGREISGKLLTPKEYYDRPMNNRYKNLYFEEIEAEREKHIDVFSETQSLSEFPDELRQIFLHLLADNSKSYQLRVADIVGYSFD